MSRYLFTDNNPRRIPSPTPYFLHHAPHRDGKWPVDSLKLGSTPWGEVRRDLLLRQNSEARWASLGDGPRPPQHRPRITPRPPKTAPRPFQKRTKTTQNHHLQKKDAFFCCSPSEKRMTRSFLFGFRPKARFGFPKTADTVS